MKTLDKFSILQVKIVTCHIVANVAINRRELGQVNTFSGALFKGPTRAG